MVSWLNRANVYVLAWCVYNSQGIFFPKGSLFTQLLIVLLILVSLYYMFVAHVRYKSELPRYFWGLDLLVLMLTLYGAFLIMGGYDSSQYAKQVESSSYLKAIYMSLLPAYSFYVFFKEKLVSERMLYVWVFVFFALATAEYFENQREMLLAALQQGSMEEEFTNNVGYVFLSLIPICVFLFKKIMFQYIGVGYCMVFLLMGMKRGAILIGAICLVFFLWNNLKKAKIKMKLLLVFLSILLCFVGYSFVKWQMHESVYFQKRVENTLGGNSSGRDKIYSTLLNYYWNEASPVQFVFGSGANATLKVSYNYAHNDWIEIAVNQGMLGLFIYALYCLLFFRESISKSHPFHARFALQLLFIICFLKTFFSMSYGDMSIPMTFVLGYSLSLEKKDGQNSYCH